MDSEGSRRLIEAAAFAGGEANRRREVTVEEEERRRQVAIELNLGRRLIPGYHGPRWASADLALLGVLPDEQVAQRTGRTVEAVRIMRTRLGIATADDRRRR
jgi:hypothetical protein